MSVCPVCSKKAYAMEAITIEGVTMHKTCFRCATCKRTLNGGNFAKNHGVYYCKVHFQQMFREKGNYDEGFGYARNSDAPKKAESPKPEPKKVEPKHEEPKKEAPKKAESPKPEPKHEPAKKEEPKKEEPPKEMTLSKETMDQLAALTKAVEKLEAASTKLEGAGCVAAGSACPKDIDAVFTRLEAAISKLEKK